MDVMQRIKQQVEENPVVIYMKGTPDFPQCGFSGRAAAALEACGANFAYINIFDDREIYENLPRFSSWPTFPQIFINGELIGGCDITVELYQRGELQKMIEEAVQKSRSEGASSSSSE